MRTICSLAIAVGVLTTYPAFAQAPERLDARWTPWLGCWGLVQETARDASPSSALESFLELGAARPARSAATRDEIRVCVAPADAGAGVRMTTFAGGRSVLEQTVFGDGLSRPVSESECRGTLATEWSRDAERLFTRAELQCDGQSKQTVSGITLLTRGSGPRGRTAAASAGRTVWLDVQAIDVNGDLQVRIRRYERAFDQTVGAVELSDDVSSRASAAAEAISAAPISIDDVIEASSKIASPAVEAALVESGSRFDLNSRTLIKLADNGVHKNVIDLMVALAFPERFRVERTARNVAPAVTSGSSSYGYYPYGSYSPYGVYDPYAYYSYYSPFAYSYWGTNYYGPGFYGPGFYGLGYYGPGYYPQVVAPGVPSGGASGSHGRVIQGRGYTQVRPNSASESSGTGPSTTSSRSNGSTSTSSNAGSSNSGSSSSSGGGSGGVSSGGYSSGGSSSGSGRTAQPR
jgi:hypothetical protein